MVRTLLSVLVLLAAVLAGAGGLAAGPAQRDAEAAGPTGPVRGWVAFRAFTNASYADVTIFYFDGPNNTQLRTQKQRVYNFNSFGCAPYWPMAGFAVGDCFQFYNVPKNQTVRALVQYSNGTSRTLSDWYSGWEGYNWMGTARN